MVWDNTGTWCNDTSFSIISVASTGTACNLTASFTHSTNGLNTNFVNTSTSTSSIVFFNWHFGDGNSSSLPNPSHTYSNPGTYNVDLIVSDSSGCLDTAFSTILIVSANCNINASFTEIITGNVVTFNSTTTGLSGPATYNWTFTNGNIWLGSGSGATTSFSFPPQQGVFTVYLAVSDSVCTDTIFRRVTVSTFVFTPNGDGIDDAVLLPCLGGSATIYNANGILIKTLAPGSPSWDGTNNLGGAEPTGLYFILCAGSSNPVPVTLIR